MLKGKPISGSMLIELAESYTQAMNKGSVPTIDTAWHNVQKTELEKALQTSLKLFNLQGTTTNEQVLKQ